MTNYIAPVAAAIAAFLGGAGYPAPAHADPSLAGDYTLFWEQNGNPDQEGQTHRAVVTSCGPDCLMFDNLDNPAGPPRPFTRISNGWKDEPIFLEHAIQCGPDGSKHSTTRTWYINAEFTKMWDDKTDVDCGDGYGPRKPPPNIARITRS